MRNICEKRELTVTPFTIYGDVISTCVCTAVNLHVVRGRLPGPVRTLTSSGLPSFSRLSGFPLFADSSQGGEARGCFLGPPLSLHLPDGLLGASCRVQVGWPNCRCWALAYTCTDHCLLRTFEGDDLSMQGRQEVWYLPSSASA